MIPALRALGLDTDADERAVRRAYAARLRTCRPDEDPVGFQVLHEAYQEALAWVRQRDKWRETRHRSPSTTATPEPTPTGDTSDSGPTSCSPSVLLPALTFRMDAPQWHTITLNGSSHGARDTAPAHQPVVPASADHDRPPAAPPTPMASEGRHNDHSPIPPKVDLQHVSTPESLLFECFEQAANAPVRVFAGWLREQPTLWSLRDKDVFGQRLLQHLSAQLPPIPAGNMDEIIRFFAFDDLHARMPASHLQSLRSTMHDIWVAEREVHGEQHIAFARAPTGGPQYDRARGHALIAENEIRRQASALRRLATEACPELLGRWWRPSMFWRAISRTRRALLLDQLARFDIDTLPQGIDRRALTFWRETADASRLSPGRLFVAVSMTVAWGFALTALGLLFAGGWTDPDESLIPSLLGGSLTALSGFAIWFSIQFSRWLIRWQARQEPPSFGPRWLHRTFMPLMLALTWPLFGHEDGIFLVAIPLAYLFILALCRFHIRQRGKLPAFLLRLGEGCDEWLSSPAYGPTLVFASMCMLGLTAPIILSGGHPARIHAAISGLILILWAGDLYLTLRGDMRRS